ncbi:hypothetical protein AGABI1DRAFT_86509 [Agaricus bisporus var. burnettii JB137-S8]|uniref:Uncharacterized protein n=1 Tax=Agaricus bisporus var. burnettii (strain JB137-S8 / ATCC MYA-4627 / FGSC 10392) TaxID=597362 RepID=K5VT23_AGABU|nr:uncharacterized protein AGABI1DRAFT_86509 [Agaricus bisporus var. burnettii JB137-S8]EKM77579.1 hypothetical protein AGABI1DRAFT_86509 [Agaricus bisporus var. burnettii JB137-S8]
MPLATSQTKSKIPSGLVAFPSVSQSLYSLTSATDVQGVSLQASFARCTSASEAKLEVALNKNLAVAKQRQKEDQERRNKEMQEAARLRMLEQQKQQIADPASPIVMKTRKPKAN